MASSHSLGRTGTCKCDPWFTGLTCDLLNLQPPQSDQQGLCHKGFDSYYSWGGRSIPEVKADLDNATKWHLYASFMCNHKSLSEWTTVSSSGESSSVPCAVTTSEALCCVVTPQVTPTTNLLYLTAPHASTCFYLCLCGVALPACMLTPADTILPACNAAFGIVSRQAISSETRLWDHFSFRQSSARGRFARPPSFLGPTTRSPCTTLTPMQRMPGRSGT